jgi:hypothetical protein
MEPSSLWTMITKNVGCLANLRRDDARFREGHRYSVWHVVRIFLFLLWKRYSSNVFYEKLAREKGFRRLYGWPTRLISHSQFKKRRKTPAFLRALLELLRYSASRALREAGSQEVRILVMDLTRINSDPKRDPYGAWGYDSSGLFFGYKLGLITSQHGIVLGLTLIKANWTELRVNRKLIHMARETLEVAGDSFDVDFLLADAGFDGNPTYRACWTELHAWALCALRRRRNPHAARVQQVLQKAWKKTPDRCRAQLLWEIPQARQLFSKRVEIERVNGQLKDDPLRIHQLPRTPRPLRWLLSVCLGKIILFDSSLIVNAQRGVELRRIKHVLAS